MLTVDEILTAVRKAQLTTEDTQKVVSILKERELIETAVVKDGPGSQELVSFLSQFWDYDTSPYIREKLAYGHRMGRRHCYDMALWVKHYWKPYFAEQQLSQISKAQLKDFSLWLAETKKLKPKTINNVIASGAVGLRWAHENGVIDANPSAGLIKFSGKAAKRGILTEEEAMKLFMVPWSDERSRLGNMLAMTTGLRAGEILAIQLRDIEEDFLQVRHSWSNLDSLKSTKNGEERKSVLIESMRMSLLQLVRKNPHGDHPESFVFWSSERADRPMDFHFLLDGLKEALLRLSLCEEELKDLKEVEKASDYWKTRGVVFHSWRHFFAARVADRIDSRKAMLATGHKDRTVFDAYADHSTDEVFEEVRRAITGTFEHLLPAPTTSAKAS